MRDMDEGDVRDRLPLLLHGALPRDEADAVRAALADDAALADELALLRALREAHAEAPAIDTARIVAALPAPPRSRATIGARPRFAAGYAQRVTRWAQAAAVVGVLSVGALATRIGRDAPDAAAPTVVAHELRVGAPLDELSVDELRALANEIRTLDGLPSEEPESGALQGGLEGGA